MTATLNLIGLVVDDMARSLAFYRRLGLAIPAEADTQPHVEYRLAEGVVLAWDTAEVIRSYDPEWTAPTGGPAVALAFEFATPAEVDKAYAELVEAGYRSHKAPWDAFWGQRYADVHDPDGNSAHLYAAL
ncbi:MAG TPA: VOC family protein [Actinospica sp.]|jgi:uncharacterized glyoxalase superfamily protein PhnB|nr:VOC family protein [Actinospica sp.]